MVSDLFFEPVASVLIPLDVGVLLELRSLLAVELL